MLPRFLLTQSSGLGGVLHMPPLPFLSHLFPFIPTISTLSSSSSRSFSQFSSLRLSSTKACLFDSLTYGMPCGAPCCKVVLVASYLSIFSFMSTLTTFILPKDWCKALIMNVAFDLSSRLLLLDTM